MNFASSNHPTHDGVSGQRSPAALGGECRSSVGSAGAARVGGGRLLQMAAVCFTASLIVGAIVYACFVHGVVGAAYVLLGTILVGVSWLSIEAVKAARENTEPVLCGWCNNPLAELNDDLVTYYGKHRIYHCSPACQQSTRDDL
jgi:hypothetical protein